MERLFNIKKIKNSIDISNSYTVKNGKKSKLLFAYEIYTATFRTVINNKAISYPLFLISDELISNEEIINLKEQLEIEIAGDGSYIEILNFENDFTIQFDQENSSFIDTEDVKNGLVIFKK